MTDDPQPLSSTASHVLAQVDHIAALQDGRHRLLDTIEGLDAAGAGQVVHGEWRVHDLLTHLAAWDELVTGFLGAVARGDREFAITAPPADDWSGWNAGQVAAATGAPLDVRLTRLHAARQDLLAAIVALDAAVLDAEVTAPWGTQDLVRGHVLAQALHDAQHADALAFAFAGR